ncbi:MAG: hypothetical protein H6742_14830 [Alphaproteobacteria bacterium]|nr:hypothetical protein [Alphaproteobacteria bacterium]
MRMTGGVLGGLVGAVLLACVSLPGEGDGAPGAAAAGLPADALRLKKVTIMDRQGYDQPVPAFSFLVPYDWKTEGGVEWTGTPHCPENVMRPWARAESPDGTLGFEIFPPVMFTWDTDPQQQQLRMQVDAMGAQGCPYLPPMAATDFIQGQVLPAYRQGAQVVAVEPMPKVTAMLDQAWGPGVQAMRQAGSPVRYQVDAGRVRIRRGDSEEWISGTTATLSSMVMPGFSNAEVQTTQAAWMFAVRAPTGQLDANEKLLATIIASYRGDPRWQAAITRLTTGIRNSQIQTTIEIGRIYRETNEQVMASQNESWRRGQATGDAVAESFSQYIRDVDEWKDPAGGNIELGAGYDHAWADGQGGYIVTQDANYNPNTALRETGWKEMERQR